MATKTVTELKTKAICDKCGYEWEPRDRPLPKICPKCKSHYWNKSEEKKA